MRAMWGGQEAYHHELFSVYFTSDLSNINRINIFPSTADIALCHQLLLSSPKEDAPELNTHKENTQYTTSDMKPFSLTI